MLKDCLEYVPLKGNCTRSGLKVNVKVILKGIVKVVCLVIVEVIKQVICF
jgi:hypothetical protein